ncbi:MAG: hypothetical protein GY872_01745, partial [Roseibacillus sp.]|nr:hypothetical protein [Roseibacillus sp.]
MMKRIGIGQVVAALCLVVPLQTVEGQKETENGRAVCRVVPLPGHRTAFEYRGKEVLV